MLKICFTLFKAWVICQNKKRPGFYTLTETRVINNSKSKKKKKNPEHTLADIGNSKGKQNFSKKY